MNRFYGTGEGLETYIKDIFASTTNETDEQVKLERLSRIYSYQGNKNNPPEVKKLESKNSAIALNSSYPKARLYADSPMITKACKETYERIKTTISNGITAIQDVEFTETKELGKVKKVDPLGITDLRIRGMWHIENPNKTFNYIYNYDDTKDFQLICLMKKEKYDALPSENLENENVSVQNIRIKNPNNPIQLIDAKLLIFKV